MTDKVLVAYASKYGSTAQIADRIAHVVGKSDIQVDERPVDQVDKITPYLGVVLGSAVYAGQWRKEAVHFLEQHADELATIPTWLFSSGPTGEGNPVDQMDGWRFPENLLPVADRIKPRDIAFFHGEIDIDKLNFGEKLIVKIIKAPVGDFRDWGRIEDWATKVAQGMISLQIT